MTEASPAARFAGLDIGSAYTKFAVTGADAAPEASMCTPVATALAWDGPRPVVGRDAIAPERVFGPLTGFLRLCDQPAAVGWSAVGWRAGGSPQDATRDFLIGLLHGNDEGCGFPELRETAGLAVTVPTSWTRTVTGVAARTWLGSLFEDDLQLPVRGLYGAAVCAAADYLVGAAAGTSPVSADGDATSGDPAGSRLLLVCDIGADAVEATLCDVGRDGTGMPVARRLDIERWAGPAGRTFAEDAVRRAFRNTTASEPTPAHRPALLAAFADALHDNQPRAAVVLERVRDDPRWLDTAIVRFGDGYRLTAADVLAGFGPVAQTVDAAVTELLRRRCDLTADVSAVDVVVVGGLGFLPPAQDAVRRAIRTALHPSRPGDEGLGAGDDGSSGTVVVHPVAHPESAAARGAALIAAGQVRAAEYYPHTLSLRVHRMRNGQLVPESVRMVTAGDVPQERVESAGTPIVVHVDGSHDDDEVVLDVRLDGSGTPRTARARDAAGIPSGDYHVGVRFDRSHLGALVLHPVAGTGRSHALTLVVAE